MVEMLGVLAIIGVLSVGGVSGYVTAMDKYKMNRYASDINMMILNLKNLFIQQPSLDAIKASYYAPETLYDFKKYKNNSSFKDIFGNSWNVSTGGFSVRIGGEKSLSLDERKQIVEKTCKTVFQSAIDSQELRKSYSVVPYFEPERCCNRFD